jgi:glycosyltransferase involved in cell wall biosynthesis
VNVVLLIRSLHVGGAERQLVELARGLQGAGHSVAVAVFYREGAFLPLLEQAGVKIYALGKRSRWHLIGPLLRLVHILKERKAQVIYSFMPAENMVALVAGWLAGNVPVAWRIAIANLDAMIYGRVALAMYWVEDALMRCPACIISNSEAAVLQHGLKQRSNVHVVPNGIDTDELKPDLLAGREWRRKNGIHDRALVVAQVGRVDPMKRVDLFLSAAAIATDKGLAATFAVIGPAIESHKQQLQSSNAARTLAGSLRWIGAQKDRRSMFNGVDCVISSSDAEGFSNVLAEAMACGCTVIATDVGDNRRMIDDMGVVVPKGSAAALAAAMTRAARPTAAERQARHDYIADRYATPRLVENTERVLGRLAEGRDR